MLTTLIFDVDEALVPLVHYLMNITRALALGFIVGRAFGSGLVFKLAWVP